MKKFIFIICLCTIYLVANSLEEAINAIKQKDYNLAIQKLNTSCKDKNSRACSILGDIYMGEILTFKDFQKGVSFYKKGCELEDSKSCYNLGFIYRDGEGVDKDLKSSLKYFQKGCYQKDSMSCYELSFFYKLGEAVKQDIKKSENLFVRSCELGYTKSCTDLALKYLKKESKNSSKAIYFATKACAKNDPVSCRLLGLIYGDKKDYLNSSTYLNLACTLKDGQSCYILSFLYVKGEGVEKSNKKAKELLLSSCELGFKNGCELIKKIDEKKE